MKKYIKILSLLLLNLNCAFGMNDPQEYTPPAGCRIIFDNGQYKDYSFHALRMLDWFLLDERIREHDIHGDHALIQDTLTRLLEYSHLENPEMFDFSQLNYQQLGRLFHFSNHFLLKDHLNHLSTLIQNVILNDDCFNATYGDPHFQLSPATTQATVKTLRQMALAAKQAENRFSTITPAELLEKILGETKRDLLIHRGFDCLEIVTFTPAELKRHGLPLDTIKTEQNGTTYFLSGLGLKSFEGLGAVIPETELPLTKLDCSFNHLEILQANSFNYPQLVQIKKITFNQAGITDIKPGAFNGLNNIQEINLSGNYIENIDPAIFEGLHHLELVNICDNPIADDTPEECEELSRILAERGIILVYKTATLIFPLPLTDNIRITSI